MAFSVGNRQSSEVIKEGYLTKEKEHARGSFWQKSELKKWWVLKQDQQGGAVMSHYKDQTKKTSEKKIPYPDFEKMDVSKHNHDDYFSIKYGNKITHFRAESRQQRDEWYQAMLRALGRLAPAGPDDDVVSVRPRCDTENLHNKPPVSRRPRKPMDIQSSPSLSSTFQAELKNAVIKSPMSQIPEGEDLDGDTAKIRQEFLCCQRHHITGHSDKGVNMVDLNIVYENVHFVRSEEEYHRAVAHRKISLARGEEVYTALHDVARLQAQPENIYESTIPTCRPDSCKGLEPGSSAANNNLDQSSDNRALPASECDLNIVYGEDDLSSKRSSLSSNEDNTKVQPVPVPPVPLHTGELLRTKTQKLNEEMRQPNGIEKTLCKTALVGERVKIKLMEKKDSIWVIGWNECKTQLRGALKVGDQLIKVNKQILSSAMFARQTIQSTDEDKVSLVLKRIPHGCVCIIARLSPSDDLGITVEGNEITCVDPCGLASCKGNLRPQATGVSGRLCNWAITEINAQPVDLFASTEYIRAQLSRAGTDVVLIVQPVDFVQAMRDSLNSEVA
ncbi:uncharacterized protein LOC110983107 [Acanthaster planci]|uniref:Uncharacterized protein LOC110983107 n=1 Tax=Acanthaster planci TaxID=133434 RepID=A0A8B7Z304_ACAPL|nr:uncharacterized protein LOC110983107 [Acanthaster planci]XP_022097756.1 uncharacterized protein LOC110983107 [Acanthaster planci]